MIRANEDELAEIFPGDSEMAAIMRRSNWADTPLGDPRGWPDGLKIPLKMLLTSRFEMWLGWGQDLLFFYNDAYIPTLGLKHPSMLGKPFRQVWAEVYDDVADQVARVRAGEATWNRALLLLLERSGYPEETYHSFSYSPLYGEGDDVEGMLCVVSEETERVIGERRIEMLRMLGAELVSAGDENAICDAVCSVLGANRRDFPFALLYLDGVGHACAADAEHLLGGDRPWNGSTAVVLGDGLRVSLPGNLECPKGSMAVAAGGSPCRSDRRRRRAAALRDTRAGSQSASSARPLYRRYRPSRCRPDRRRNGQRRSIWSRNGAGLIASGPTLAI
ncbi:PAS domain-containing protein [Parvibaculum sp.]|uniref:PAS domain-containing protein n=1 Tax=Parvibaculum sp. TaxID=2024848 RepID=UPI003BA87ECE